MSQINRWYQLKSVKFKLLVHFIFNLIFWILAEISITRILEEKKTIAELMLNAIWMAIWMTTISEWGKIRLLFRKNK